MTIEAVVPIRREPDPDLVRTSQEFADRVKSGEIVAFCIAAQCSDRAIATLISFSGDYDIFRLMGAVTFLTRRLSDRCEQLPDAP